MTSDNLSALIARLEAATQSSRELDAEIGVAKFVWEHGKEIIGLRGCYHPPYTRSIDCALTLVPEGWVGLVGLGIRPGCRLTHNWGRLDEVEAVAETSALALCIVALKARQTTTAPTGEHTTT